MADTLTGPAAPSTERADYAARIDHVSKAFGRPGAQQLVLDDITLDVRAG